MYPALIAQLAERVLNTFLKGDPDTAAQLSELAGRTVAIDVLGTDIVLCVLLEARDLRVSAEPPDSVDVTLSGTPAALMGLLLSEPTAARVRQSGIKIAGDVAVAQRFNAILDAMDIDWEEQLARVVGDPLAHQVGRAAAGLREWEAGARAALLEDVGEYLKHESRLVASSMELGMFAAGVDRVRDDTERLEQRVKRLLVTYQRRSA